MLSRQISGKRMGLLGRDFLYPKYAIHNKLAFKDSWNAGQGGISNHTANTDIHSSKWTHDVRHT
jgi:alpha-glucosidase